MNSKTKTHLTEHLTETERLILLQFALEHSKEFDPNDSVEEVLISAFDKLANTLRLSSDW